MRIITRVMGISKSPAQLLRSGLSLDEWMRGLAINDNLPEVLEKVSPDESDQVRVIMSRLECTAPDKMFEAIKMSITPSNNMSCAWATGKFLFGSKYHPSKLENQ